MNPKYSIIVAVYNRPDETEELLESLTRQLYTNFEIIIVEDGSTNPCQTICERYSSRIALTYYFKPNTGPGPTRNYGMERARGAYFVLFDSDCVIPVNYFNEAEKFLEKNNPDVWGGPDRGHWQFTLRQQAMAFTMTSFLLTGGMRGAKKSIGWQPRSYNMGLRREVFEKTGGFGNERIAEDSLWSIRIKEAGFAVKYAEDAFVYHKRRSAWRQFFRQVAVFGKGRVQIGRRYPSELRLVHWIPALFLLGLFSLPLAFFINPYLGSLLVSGLFLYFSLIASEGLLRTNSLAVSFAAIPSACIQLAGYGFGFLKEKIRGKKSMPS